MAPVACVAAPRAPHVSAHMSIIMLWSHVKRHLVLLHVTPHALITITVTPRASLDTYPARQLPPRPELIHQTTSCFSVHSPDIDSSGFPIVLTSRPS
ncbi:hypothetical protein DY000_02006235 [Brassica cretica]|uniref:Secreted protein n=1 Tax=Brassica cretica TaxID=69181 RepID=A0ABQ7CA49_BRACR|nr:hypothetical protein DY000_02006235 [Brassica cretica]